MRILTAIGNEELQERVRDASFDIIDEVDSLEALEDLVELMPMEGLILNRLLDNTGDNIIRICKKAKYKGIKVVIITDDFNSFEEKKLIGNLVNQGVTVYLKLDEVTPQRLEDAYNNYPQEFNYSLLAEPQENIKVERVVESVFKEVITVYSPLSQGSTTTAVHLAFALASSKKCRVCVVDFNPLKPAFKKVFNTSFEFTLPDVLDAVARQNLTYERLESLTKAYKMQTNLDILPGIYDFNEYYSSERQQYKEIIEKLKFNYDYVIIDTHSWFDVVSTDIAIKLADKVVVPVYGNIKDIEEVNRFIKTFEMYDDYDIRKFKYVINKYNGEDLTFIEIDAKLHGDIAGYISYHRGLEKGNGFSNKKIINEYIDVLNSMGVRINKKANILSLLRKKA
ncbi:AAA family ATPase [Alkaliphilus pronyensis]|uniref:AAA family ATPase n=1 Tax=Alkaliphilus pronyensis TaxID=1482732 RepID=A0A6I0F056_9FIRM|nr:AAA family ATPase [Alkaliphilus pronyensis]KAB3535638.1 AAA family ATPase [Alkaliphilus pronyensis]